MVTGTPWIHTFGHTLSLLVARPLCDGDTLAGAGEAIERAWQEVAAEAEADGAGSDGDTGILGPGPAPGQEALEALGCRRVIEQGGFGFRQATWNEHEPRLPTQDVALPVWTFVGLSDAGMYNVRHHTGRHQAGPRS